jgi:hypothetical protein
LEQVLMFVAQVDAAQFAAFTRLAGATQTSEHAQHVLGTGGWQTHGG